jgi:hypothetical protein
LENVMTARTLRNDTKTKIITTNSMELSEEDDYD